MTGWLCGLVAEATTLLPHMWPLLAAGARMARAMPVEKKEGEKEDA